MHGHILNLILSPSNSSFGRNVAVGDLVSDHALVKCHLDFACPSIPKVDNVLYCRYHKIHMQSFCKDLANTFLATSPPSTAAGLYDQCISYLGGVLVSLRNSHFQAKNCKITDRYFYVKICGVGESDIQEWMSSSMPKLNPDKTEFIIFGSYAQLKKLIPYLPVRMYHQLL